MIRTLLIGASVGFALAIACTAAWQPERGAIASPSEVSDAPQANQAANRPDDLIERDRTPRESEITPELIERVISVARRLDPAMAAELRALCDEHPDRLERALRTSARRYVALAELKVRDPDLYMIKIAELQSEARIAVLASQIAEARLATDESRETAVRRELLHEMRIHVSMSLAARTQSIKRLEEHLAALKAELERDTHTFEQTVERKMAEAIDNALREAEAAVARRR